MKLTALVRGAPHLFLLFGLVLNSAKAQTAFLNFNTVGHYTNNFFPWDNSNGTNAGHYSFEEDSTNGVGGSGGVAVFQSTDTTATYKTGSWNFSTNTATILVSTLIHANGQSSTNNVQLGIINTSSNGFNANSGVSFETYRFVPASATSWRLYQQYRKGSTTTTSGSLGSVLVTAGHWYKFVVGLTNSSGAPGNLTAGCALYDYGTSGLTPGTNLITFSTTESLSQFSLATDTSVWAAFSAYEDAGISAWDNFFVYTAHSAPVFTLALSNVSVVINGSLAFNALADGPGAISYSWYTNGGRVSGVTGTNLTIASAPALLTNVSVVASNSNGSVTNSSTVTILNLQPPQITNSPASDIQISSATMGGVVLSTGGLPTSVAVYYGTNDGGTNPAAWSQSVALGTQTGAFSTTVALSANTTYFFTCEASNALGVAWASPSLAFTTTYDTTPISFMGNGAGWTVNQLGLSTAVISNNIFHTTDGGGFEAVTGWYDALVYIDGFVASFTYQNLGGAPGSNDVGITFDLQESGPAFLGDPSVELGINDLVPSINWRVIISTNLGLGITCDFNGGGQYPDQTTGNVDVSSGDPINFTLIYAPGGAVQETLVDAITEESYTTNYNIGDVTEFLGSSYAYIGFSASDDELASTQTISDFAFQTEAGPLTAATVTNQAAQNIEATSATLNGLVLATGGVAPDVTIYYGSSDGGTNPVHWAYSAALGIEEGAFSQTVTNLQPDTVYYFTCAATNFAGQSWAAASQSFQTITVGLPQVVNLPATSVSATLATLNGTLLSNGNAPTAITLYYGTNDGGATAGEWPAAIALGLQGGSFAQTIGPLLSNTTYYATASASNLAGVTWASPSIQFTTQSTNPVSTLAAVLTYHNDNTRCGVNSNETILTPANVSTNLFGKLFTCALDGLAYAQPLVMTNVTVPGLGVHNVVYVATEHDSIYAFDAQIGTPLWKTSFLGSNVTTVPASDVGTADIAPEIGITSTPVIDPVSGTLYCEVKTLEQGSNVVHRLHALNITTGLEQTNFNSPVVIQCTNYLGNGGGDNDGQNPPHVNWNPLREHCRPAMTLLNGVVYLSFASHGDNPPYHGWLFGYNATNLCVASTVFCSTPNGSDGGFWDAGDGMTVDCQNNLYFQSGNGSFDSATNITATNNYSMSLLKFSTSNGLQLVDFFSPSNAIALSSQDGDLGSGAPLALPDSAGSAAHPHLIIGGGKAQTVFLLDRDNLGTFNSSSNNDVQQFNGAWGGNNGISPAFFHGTLFIFDYDQTIGAFTISNALINTVPVEAPDYYPNRNGASVSISANGTNNGIVWAIYNDGTESPSTPAILRAYNAGNIAQELYSSDQVSPRDTAADAVKMTVPTIANGLVYVGGQYALNVYGLASNFVYPPVIAPNGGVYTNSVTVTMTDVTQGASIYYTLDGSTPTTNSALYTEAFALTNSVTVTAEAFVPGGVPSGLTTASFINSSLVGNGTGLVGSYWANTTGAQFLLPGFDTAPTLVRTDPEIDFNWSGTQPATNVGPDTFCVEWTGTVVPQFSETYSFTTLAEDGVMLWINGQLLIDEWMDQNSPATYSNAFAMTAQQSYNIVMDYYQDSGNAEAELFWSSPSLGPASLIPQSQLYPVTNSPPSVALTAPTNEAVFTADASVTLEANAAGDLNPISEVAFFNNGQLAGVATEPPYAVTVTGLTPGTYLLTAVASDTSGLATPSATVSITVLPGSGLPYGLANYPPAPAFYNMPPVFTGPLPQQLSLTGVFSDTPNMVPASTLIPYVPNVVLFSDNAQKVRYFSIPNSGGPLAPSEQIAYAPTGTWSFPAGTVFVKTFELQTNTIDPAAPLMRLETRLLVRDTNGAVYGVTYKWRPDYSDADLLTSSLNETVDVTTPNGVVPEVWYYPSPSDCLQCHTSAANYVLGVNARQLNGSNTYPSGVTDNQLRALNRTGLFYPAIDDSQIPSIEYLSAVTNPLASYVQRARSYLDANCAQCHQPGGPGPTFDARYDTPLAQQDIIGVPAVKGSLGYDNMDIVTPNDVWRSSIYDRMNEVNPVTQMPPLARNLIDVNAVSLMASWIDTLGGTPTLPPPVISPASGTYEGYVDVNVDGFDPGGAFYYTLDGSTPTTNSIPYTGPVFLTNSSTFTVNSWASGYIDSVISSAQYAIVNGIFFIGSGQLVGGQFQMTFAAPVGSSYVLQVSTNLVNWTPIATNTPAASPFILTDPAPPGLAAYYRVLQLP